jgi:hypothetical protein
MPSVTPIIHYYETENGTSVEGFDVLIAVGPVNGYGLY